MKELIKKIIAWKLSILARMYLARFKPEIIAITGNVGKTSTKEAIATVMAKVRKVRSSKGNLNNELGVPLTIVGDWADDYYDAGNSVWFWSRVLWLSFIRWFFTKNYPEVLVLEYGADRPGDVRRLAKKFRPHIGVITAVGEVPVHIEYFSGPEAVAREKAKLIEKLLPSDFAVLNFDDLAVLDMKDRTKARTYTYGFGQGADIRVSNLDFLRDDELGIGFKINYNDPISGQGSFVPVKIIGSLGASQALASAAATAIGLIHGMNLVHISGALSDYHGPKGRMKVIKGIKNTTIVDDTYNASPASMHLALDTLREAPGRRKIAVLGDMLELGKYTVAAHEAIGNLAGSFVDVLVCVGERAKFIADAARNQLSQNIFTFETSYAAKAKVQELLQEGDLVLVKGSQGMRMEKIVEEIMAEPERKKELLVRQSKRWLSR